jgi:hypothetical protein
MKTMGAGKQRVRAVTSGTLGGGMGKDRGRRLVLELTRDDLIELRPMGTRQTVQVSAMDVYRWALLAQARMLHLEKARRVKELKALKRLEREEKRLRKKWSKG